MPIKYAAFIEGHRKETTTIAIDVHNQEEFRQQLAQDGYCVVTDILDSTTLKALRGRFNDDSLSDTSKENFGDSGAFIIADYHDPIMIRLLTWPQTLETLKRFGFPAPKLHNFYVSTKPPRADGLAWHSDLFYRYDETAPAELFLIYYLQDTTPENGCLRVVPGSHLWSHEKRHAQPENSDLRADEIDVSIKAGSLFIGDRRIMHATHANMSSVWRTCLTIAYAPTFDNLPESIKALIVRNRCLPPQDWPKNPDVYNIDPTLAAILPVYVGSASPIAL